MIFNLPAILGLLPLVLYIILMLRGKDMNVSVLICVVLGAILTKQTPLDKCSTEHSLHCSK